MNLDALLDRIGDYGKDVRINFKNMLAGENTPGLDAAQNLSTVLACVYATKSKDLMKFTEEYVNDKLSAEQINAAKAAASLMAMNNVYYRTIHLAEDKEWSKLPAKLRMTVIANPGVPKLDFEAYCLAVSAMSGCGMCINAHISELKKAGLSNEGIQSLVRIAAIVNSMAQAIELAA